MERFLADTGFISSPYLSLVARGWPGKIRCSIEYTAHSHEYSSVWVPKVGMSLFYLATLSEIAALATPVPGIYITA